MCVWLCGVFADVHVSARVVWCAGCSVVVLVSCDDVVLVACCLCRCGVAVMCVVV